MSAAERLLTSSALRECGLWPPEVSTQTATHSRNIAARPQVSIVVFDSRADIGAGQGVYMRAEAEELDGAELQRGIEIFSRRSVSHGARPWTLDDVSGSPPFRVYRATASEHSVLAKDGAPDHRVSVDLADQGTAERDATPTRHAENP